MSKRKPETFVTRRNALKLTGATMAGSALAAPALAAGRIEWRMATSWPKNLPGPGVTARRITERIEKMSAGRLKVTLYAAEELVPALGVFDAVTDGAADMAHTASFFWQGKLAAAPFFTAVPFGLTPMEHIAWIEHGGGQALWDRLYAPAGIKPYMGGNTGYQMGGWYRNEIRSLEDIKGLTIRMPGLGGEVIRRMGATPVSVPPGQITTALKLGQINATEFLGPWSDHAMGFYKYAKNYYYPGFHEPNGTGEALVSLKSLAALPADLRAIVEEAVRAENSYALAESEWQNAGRLRVLTDDLGVTLRRFPDDVLDAARAATKEVLATFEARGGIDAEILASFKAARERQSLWGKVSVAAFLAARD